MSDVGWVDEAVVAGLAGGTWIGAAVAPAVCRPPVMAALGIVMIVIGRRWMVRPGARAGTALAAVALIGGAFVLAGHRGGAVDDGYQPLPSGPLPSPVEVIGDPEPLGLAGWRVDVRLADGARVEAVAHGRAGVLVSRLLVGQSIEVDGRLRPVGDRDWLRTRHIVARASITDVEVGAGPGLWRGTVEGVRQWVRAGGDSLDERPRALYHGLVLGDDRFQPPGQTLRFRLSGLTHLLAVSGQNVAFVLAVLAPVTGRLGPRSRLTLLLVALTVFALITRLEPSVLRAVTTAGLSTWAAISGRTRSGVGVLAVAVSALVLIDPFLVDSVGFQLSVAASAGILLLTPSLHRLLPGPPWLVAPLATGLGAQLAVAPLLSHYFGPVSLVAIPANLLAGWAAAATMIWGMSIGPVAGLLPTPVGSVVQLPVVALLWWLETVAAVGARAPGPRPDLVLVVILAGCLIAARAVPAKWPRWLVVVLAATTIVASVPRPSDRAGMCGPGIRWFPPAADRLDGDGLGPAPAVLVVGPDAGLRSIESCRRAGIRSVDLVIATSGGRTTGPLIAALQEVASVDVVWAPPMHRIVGARRRVEPARIATVAGWLDVEPVDRAGRRLSVESEP